MSAIEIAGINIGQNHPCFIIAEGCDNHLGSLEAAKEMALQAKICGADAIKFQHHLPEEEMLREGVPMSSNFNMPLFDFLKKYALTLEQHKELMEYCEKIEITYMCTPFSLKAAKEMLGIGLNLFKIGSGELTDIPSLVEVAKLGKPMILSTGMATWEEIDETVKALLEVQKNIALMNCVSEYPAKYEDINLGVIPQMMERYGLVIGHSDHTPDIYTTIASVTLGSKIVEKHFILDKRQPGPDQAVSIDPFELKEMVKGIRNVELAMGKEKKIHDFEKPIRAWAHRSVVSISDINPGEKISLENVWTKRPGTGIPSKKLKDVLGKTAKVQISKDSLISWDMLQ